MTEHFQLELDGQRLTAVTYPARRPIGATFLLGHGVLVMTYDFPFMAHGHRSPDRFDVLEATQSMAVGGDELDSVDGIVVLGYPLHPIGRAELRNACGTRLPDRSEIYPIEGGDHSLYIREKDVHDEVADEVARWITQNLEGAS